MQMADSPGHPEPGTDEIHFVYWFRNLDQSGCTGWIGCEYRPLARTEAGLGWLQLFNR
jgi:hydroxypyruvate isomerase